MEKQEIARKNLIRKSKEAKGETIKGYDFERGFDFGKLIDSFATTGAQASNFSKAVEIIKEMKKEKAFVYLGYTSNMVTTGVRETIKFLVKNRLVDVLVTTAGGIEEDFIKCFGDFKLGDFNMDGKKLRDDGINRAGNILIPNSRYVEFEKWVLPLLKKHKGKIKTSSELIRIMGEEINNEDSVYYWAWKNKIPVFCPAIMDGSLGDMIYFFKNSNPDFTLDSVADVEKFNNSTIGKKKTGMIILGGGVVKHSICNANMYRNGADYAVYINTGQEFDCSDSGARPDEAVSWGKISKKAKSVKVFGDATIIFPLIVGKAFF
jgi:deoxyhypusine synthase